jgi:hypothetical protein
MMVYCTKKNLATLRGLAPWKKMLVAPVNKVVDEKRVIGKTEPRKRTRGR